MRDLPAEVRVNQILEPEVKVIRIQIEEEIPMRDPTAEVRVKQNLEPEVKQILDEVKIPGLAVKVKIQVEVKIRVEVKIPDRDHRIQLIPDMADAAPQ